MLSVTDFANINDMVADFLKNSLSFKLLYVPLVLLGACSTTPQYTGEKYWHHGSERPYRIKGVMYYPQVHYRYAAIGEASWYGYDCQGLPTAIGVIFRKNKLTAAHRTLPLPSVVVVENLENGKRVRLLVNDRGPFAKTNRRVIDVTQRAAELLGFRAKGFARVKVTCLAKASRIAALAYKRKPY
ncbi:MAG: septal ring lytic transglycosylase RlpA family protein [Holosporaceae bacterium]|jgi:rare lipoprotein A|nr:septal ring lytic transglycosylase RlpA family protein [Holosporaceae bacterium]